jgi:hypothetical protein
VGGGRGVHSVRSDGGTLMSGRCWQLRLGHYARRTGSGRSLVILVTISKYMCLVPFCMTAVRNSSKEDSSKPFGDMMWFYCFLVESP